MEPQSGIEWNGNGKIEVLTFGLGCATFAVEAEMVREILDPIRETRVPCCPYQIASIINYRGRIIPLADLRPAFRQPVRPKTADSRFVVVECPFMNPTQLLAIKADRVYEVTLIEKQQMDGIPNIGMNIDPTHLRGVVKSGDELILVPDIRSIFAEFCHIGNNNASLSL